jgi:hypothetical protein
MMPGTLYRVVGSLALPYLFACASPSEMRSPYTIPAAVKMFPQCQREIQAFVDLTGLARGYGDDWVIFKDAIDDIKAQVAACIDGDRPPSDPPLEENRPPLEETSGHTTALHSGERGEPLVPVAANRLALNSGAHLDRRMSEVVALRTDG